MTANPPHYVYEAYDRGGSALYVGCTANVGGRLAAHALCSEWWPNVAHLAVVRYEGKFEGLAAEQAAIKFLEPAHNVRDHPLRDRHNIAAAMREERYAADHLQGMEHEPGQKCAACDTRRKLAARAEKPAALETSGTAVKAMREGAGITVRQLAREVGISHSHLVRVESGERKPAPATLRALLVAIATWAPEDEEVAS